jgi:membrane protein insertase Oxa1/YidC/SpoIIIJ
MKSVIIGRKRADAAKELNDIRGLARDAVLLRDQKLLQDVDREYKSRLQSQGLTNNPFQGLGYAAFLQLPWTLTMFLSLRGMATHPDQFNGFCCESSLLWCPSLALPDPYGILPLMSTLLILRSVNKSAVPRNHSKPTDMRYFRYAMTGATLTFLPFAMQLPSGMILFFLFNTIFNRITTPFIHRYMSRQLVK